MHKNPFPPDGGNPLSSPRLKPGASRGHSVMMMPVPERTDFPEPPRYVIEDQFPGFWLALALISLGWLAHPRAFWFHTHPGWFLHNAVYSVWVIGCWILGAVAVRGLVLRFPHRLALVAYALPPPHADDQDCQPTCSEQSLQTAMDHPVSSASEPMPTDAFRIRWHPARSRRYAIDAAQPPGHPRQSDAPRRPQGQPRQSQQSDRATAAQRNPQRMPGWHGGSLGGASRSQEEMPRHPLRSRHPWAPAHRHARPGMSQHPSDQRMTQLVHHHDSIEHAIDHPPKDHGAHAEPSDWLRYCYWWELRYPIGYLLSWALAFGLLHWTWR